MKIVATKSFADPLRAARGPLLAGVAVVAVTFCGFGGWAATAPLASASIASGQVSVSSRRQTIQHLEGGIIAEIHARDGALVEAGDLLIRMDDVKPRANYELVRGQYLTTLGERSRLEAERDGLPDIAWHPELLALKDTAEVQTVMRGQANVFRSRRDYLLGQERIIREKGLQLEQEILALDSQERSGRLRSELIAEEMAVVEDMVKRGLERRPRLLALQRASAEIEGSRGDLKARMARSRQAISELQAQFSDTKNKMMTETVTQLRDAESKIADLGQRLRAGKDQLDRIEIRAPRAGYVVNMAYHTVGGVIEPGRPILDLVPTNDNLLIETRLDPKDIDVLRVGLAAEITLTPYNRRSVPPVQGTLVLLSADSLVDQKTGASYFAGRVEVDRSELAHLPNVKLVPGMPVEVMIRTGERTALDYLVDPFKQSINRAFREK